MKRSISVNVCVNKVTLVISEKCESGDFVFIDISPEGRATVGSSATPWQPVGRVKQASVHIPVCKN